tara:strand:+ start:2270 stop:3973 length:1704 start_codon:yes stop_codon:yes gene_type:complete
MLSVSGNYWEEVSISNRILEKVKNERNLSDILSKLIVSRGFTNEEIESVNNSNQLFNPFLRYKDFEQTNTTLDFSIKNNEKILIIGDYDVDGCVSTSLFVNFFKKIKIKHNYFIPNRFKDGYGVTKKLIKNLIKEKPDLIIMLDCGSNSFETIEYIRLNKIKSIIIDHHEIYKPYPKANNILNPKKECIYSNFNYLCTASLTYFFLDQFIKKKKLKISFEKNLIYVLLATICDVMPLREINRSIALKVLKEYKSKDNFIFQKILEKKNFNRKLELEDFGFLVGPIFNSAGRLEDPNIVVNLLTTENYKIQEKIIERLIELNEKRKKIEEKCMNEFNIKKIEKKDEDILIEHEKKFNEGIIGILASKLKEYFNKPTIIMTKSENFYKASCRSTFDFNIGKYIHNCIQKKLIISGGGHNLAAGFLIKKENINKLKDYMNLEYNKNKKPNIKKFLSKISFSALSDKFFKDINKASPFGQSNENPFFLLENVKIIKPIIIKDKFISFYGKSKNGKMISCISFNLLESKISKFLLNYKKEINLIVQMKENRWNNKKNLQLIVSDIIEISNKA